MKVARGGILFALCLLLPGIVAAEAMVLVQGYLGEDDPWRRSGVTTAIQRAGWQDGGHLMDGPDGVHRNGPGNKSAKGFYTMALPTEAPLLVQAHCDSRLPLVRSAVVRPGDPSE